MGKLDLKETQILLQKPILSGNSYSIIHEHIYLLGKSEFPEWPDHFINVYTVVHVQNCSGPRIFKLKTIPICWLLVIAFKLLLAFNSCFKWVLSLTYTYVWIIQCFLSVWSCYANKLRIYLGSNLRRTRHFNISSEKICPSISSGLLTFIPYWPISIKRQFIFPFAVPSLSPAILASLRDVILGQSLNSKEVEFLRYLLQRNYI